MLLDCPLSRCCEWSSESSRADDPALLHAEVAQALNAVALKTQTDVLCLAQRLEKGAVNAYIGVIPSFGDKALAQVSARLATDEAMHWIVLSQALKDPLPASALSFGA
jgi:rubrerythrin